MVSQTVTGGYEGSRMSATTPIDSRDPERQNLEVVSDMENEVRDGRSGAERFSDWVVNAAGTPAFALGHVVFFGVWVATQSGVVPSLPVFDPYPFTFLTFIVSLEAIFLSIFVLISQGRLTRQADRRSHLDLQVNLLAEQESTNALRLLHTIAEHLGVEGLPSEDELEARTNIQSLIDDIDDVTE